MSDSTTNSHASPQQLGRGWMIPLLAGALLLLAAQSAWACPSCSDSLPAGADVGAGTGGDAAGNSPNLAGGFYYSILFMLAMIFSVVCVMGGTFYWLLKKADANPINQTGNAATPAMTAAAD